jgi:hypothetical protein
MKLLNLYQITILMINANCRYTFLRQNEPRWFGL